jgi:hypothetical protein
MGGCGGIVAMSTWRDGGCVDGNYGDWWWSSQKGKDGDWWWSQRGKLLKGTALTLSDL